MRDRWYRMGVVRRLPKLLLEIPMFGLAIALMAESQLGLGPWETQNQGWRASSAWSSAPAA